MGNIINLEAWRLAVSESLTQFAGNVGRHIPTVAAALLVLLIGWGVSRLVAMIFRRALHRFGFDKAAEQLNLTGFLRRANVTAAPSAIVARVLWWILMLTFLLTAVEMLGLRAVATTIDRLITYLPNVAAALVIVVIGLIVGRKVRDLVRSAADMARLPQASRLASLARGLVVLLTSVLALEQLGVETEILVTVITTLVGIMGFTMGLAFALGARPLVTHILAGHSLRQSIPSGRLVEVSGRKGMVEEVGAVNTLFSDGDRTWTIPNGALLEEVINR